MKNKNAQNAMKILDLMNKKIAKKSKKLISVFNNPLIFPLNAKNVKNFITKTFKGIVKKFKF